MPLKAHEIADRLVALCTELREEDHELVATACNIACDTLADQGTPDLMLDESLLDGIRWGHRAAQTVERDGGAIIRIRAPGGSAVSHEFRSVPPDGTLATLARRLEDVIKAEAAE